MIKMIRPCIMRHQIYNQDQVWICQTNQRFLGWMIFLAVRIRSQVLKGSPRTGL
jgi:hypothetical protein